MFYIQAWQDQRTITVIIEKAQLQSLAVGVEQFLAQIMAENADLAEASGDYVEEKMRINPPVEPLFRVGEIGLGYEKDRDLVVLFVKELLLEDADPEIGCGGAVLGHAQPDPHDGALGGGSRPAGAAALPAVRPAHGTRRSFLPEEERAQALTTRRRPQRVANTSSLEQLQSALRYGEIELKGQFMLGSNYTFLVDVYHGGEQYPAVYKPLGGEQPLWDFPENTLALREVAAYLVSEFLGFHFVPYTTLRTRGRTARAPSSSTSLTIPNITISTFLREDRERLRPTALFDLLVNNADRKGSHILIENGTRKLWLIDHGICFHEQDKLRTVVWDFAGQPIPEDLLERLKRIPEMRGLLEPYLSREEIAAQQARAKTLLRKRAFPHQPTDRRAMPWPLI